MLGKSISLSLLLVLSQTSFAVPQCDSSVLQATVEKYLTFEIAQDWQAIYGLRTSQFKAQVPKDEFSEQLGAFVNEIWLVQFSWISAEQDNDQCLVKVELSLGFLPGQAHRVQRLGPNGNRLEEKIDMWWVEQNGSWEFVESSRAFQPFNTNE